MSMNMRHAQEGDHDALSRLFSLLSGHEMSGDGVKNRLDLVEKSPIDSLFVCEQDGKVIGLLGFRIRENLEEVTRYGEISAIVVDPEMRKQGAGRFMMAFAEETARKEGCIGTWLVSGFGREEDAHVFYRRLGYRETGYRFVRREGM